MKFWFIQSWLSVFACLTTVWAQTSPPATAESPGPKSKKDTKSIYAIEKLVIEPADMGIEAQKTIDGMVINLKSPVKVIANDKEQSSLVMSSEFRDKNQRFAVHGMHSWLSVSYKITDENDKQVTLWLMEFDNVEHAKKFGGAQLGVKNGEEDNRDTEFKGEVFYQYTHNTMLLKITWSDAKTPGVDKIVSAYKARLLTF
jgi:hypothetical protein